MQSFTHGRAIADPNGAKTHNMQPEQTRPKRLIGTEAMGTIKPVKTGQRSV